MNGNPVKVRVAGSFTSYVAHLPDQFPGQQVHCADYRVEIADGERTPHNPRCLKLRRRASDVGCGKTPS
jgi:hypothetical protein